jgi:UvrD-like helicase C-terminal domain/Nuclease-related domain/AAA domain
MRMIPEQIGPRTSRAERDIFNLLEAVEIPGWTYAFHSLNLPEHERKRVCEIDFLLLGGRGLLVLEAKGGSVSRRNGIWYSKDLRGVSHRLKESPLEQASTAMFALETKLAQRTGRSLTGRTVFGHGAIFPDVSFDTASVEWAPEMILDSAYMDVDALAAGLDQLASFWENKPGRRRRISLTEVGRYLNLLRPDFDLVPGLRHLSRTIEAELVALTELQYRALDTYAQNPRMIFEGGAGTGKTMLAAEICRRAATAGLRVLLTCRSGVLARFIRAQPGLDGVVTVPFHQVAELPPAKFDLVVVDEGQDIINRADLKPISQVLTGGLVNGQWAFLLDSNNQRGLVGRYEDDAMAELLSYRPAKISLIDNCRNTVEIVADTQSRTGADLGSTSAGHGLPVTSVNGPRTVVAAEVAQVLERLEEEQVPMDKIVLLSPHDLTNSIFAALPEHWRHRIDALDLERLRAPTPGRIGFTQIAKFKGLESPFVMLESPDSSDATVARALLYVGMTRARAALWLIDPAADHEESAG